LRYTLKKSELLRSKKRIQELFEEGSSFFLYPFKVFYLKNPSAPKQVEVLFTVSRRHLSNAVDRNTIRRRMKEAYRLNKPGFLELMGAGISISVAIIYIGKLKLPYTEIENKLKSIFIRLINTESNQTRKKKSI